MASSDSDASAKIDASIDKPPDWSRKISEDVRACIHKSAPSLEEAVKWNSPCFVGQKNICGFMAFKEHVTPHFWNGVIMSDSEGLFNHSGDNACGRGIDFFEGDKAPKTKLAKYMKEAVRLDAKGEAIEWMAQKAEYLEVKDATQAELKEHQCRYHANLGTFHVHRWLKSEESKRNPEDLEESPHHISAALEINPDAHFKLSFDA